MGLRSASPPMEIGRSYQLSFVFDRLDSHTSASTCRWLSKSDATFPFPAIAQGVHGDGDAYLGVLKHFPEREDLLSDGISAWSPGTTGLQGMR